MVAEKVNTFSSFLAASSYDSICAKYATSQPIIEPYVLKEKYGEIFSCGYMDPAFIRHFTFERCKGVLLY